MKDKISPRSGILDCEQGNATFYEENYNFRIMNNIPFQNSPDANISAKIKSPINIFMVLHMMGNLLPSILVILQFLALKLFLTFIPIFMLSKTMQPVFLNGIKLMQ